MKIVGRVKSSGLILYNKVTETQNLILNFEVIISFNNKIKVNRIEYNHFLHQSAVISLSKLKSEGI